MKNKDQIKKLEAEVEKLDKQSQAAFKKNKVVKGVNLSEKAEQKARTLYNLKNPDKPIL